MKKLIKRVVGAWHVLTGQKYASKYPERTK